MPHVVILYTPDLEADGDIGGLCRSLAAAMAGVRDEADRQVFPTGGIRVLAYPAAHFAVADGSGPYGFCYLNLRMARGRSPVVQQATGQALAQVAKTHFAALLSTRHFGLTLQIDEGPEVFDAKLGNLHPLFAKG